MKQPRDEQTATLLANGKVLIAGGESLSGNSTATTELYDPLTGAWTLTGNMHAGRLEHAAVLLKNGTVLVSGGKRVTAATVTFLPSAEIYNATTGFWTTTGNMHARRANHTSTLLKSGLVLDAGGAGAAQELATAETYQP
jgi:Galactose oxidase, central domain